MRPAPILRLAAIACLLPCGAALAQTASLENAVFEDQYGNVITDTQTGSNSPVTIHAPFSISNLGNNVAWIEVDFCSHWWSQDAQGGRVADLPTCTDGYGHTGRRVYSNDIVSDGTNASISGVFDTHDWLATGLWGSPPGDTFSATLRVMVRDASDSNATPRQIGPDRVLTAIEHSEPHVYDAVNYKAISSDQPSPVDGSLGYYVTFRVRAYNQWDTGPGWRYAKGVTTLAVHAPRGGQFVSATQVPFSDAWFNTDAGYLPALGDALHSGQLDDWSAGAAHPTANLPAVGSSADAIFTIDNLFSIDSERTPLQYEVTWWVAPGLDENGNYRYAQVYADSHWEEPTNPSDFQDYEANDFIYLLPPGTGRNANLSLSNNQNNGLNGHTDYDYTNPSYPKIVAPGHNIDPMTDAASWAPQEGGFLHRIDFSASNAIDGHYNEPLLSPVVTYQLDPDTEFDSLYTIYEYHPGFGWDWIQPNAGSNWQVWWSADPSCAEGTFQQTPGGVGPLGFETLPPDLTQIRCVRWLIPEGQYAASANYVFFIAFHLKPEVRDILTAHPGAYHFVNSHASASLGFDANWYAGGWQQYPAGVTVEAPPRQDTFWNTEAPGGSEGSDTGTVGIGSHFRYLLEGPYQNPDSYHVMHNVHIRDVLPPDLDVDGDPYFYADRYDPNVNGTDERAQLQCTITHNGGAGQPASFDCVLPGTIGQNVPGTDLLPDDPSQCVPFYPNIYGAGQVHYDCFWDSGYRSNIANWYAIWFPVKVLGGASGEILRNCQDLWSETPAPAGTDPDPANHIDGYWGAVISESHPHEACTNVTINGSPEIVLTKTHPVTEEAVIGQEFTWDVTYTSARSATAGVSDFYVYDLIGRQPDGSLPDGCVGDATFTGVTHISGNPSVVEYTTDSPPAIGSTWLPLTGTTPPGVTGIRIQPTSQFDSAPGAFNPGDPPGVERVSVTVPKHAGMSMCNGAIQQFHGGGPPAAVFDDPVKIKDLAITGGPYHFATGAAQTCAADVILDGSGSSAANDSTIAWTEGQTLLSTDLVAHLSMAPGTHNVTLTITDSTGLSTSDSTTVDVNDDTPPAITCPSSQTIPLDPGACQASASFTAQATDNCSVSSVSCDSVILAAGQSTQVTCQATDGHGNGAGCSFTVTAAQAGEPTFTLGAPSGTASATSGALCSDSGVRVPFTYTETCSAAQPSFTATYADGSGPHALSFAVSASGTQAGSLIFDTAGLTLDTDVLVTADFAGRQATASFHLHTAPCTTSCTNVLYLPGKGIHQPVLFEDQWPVRDDLDFNDLTVTFNYNFALDSNFNVSAMELTYNVLSAGATIHNALKVHLDGLPKEAVGTVQRLAHGKPTVTTITPDPLEDDLVLTIADDVLALFPGGYVNTEADQPTRDAVTISLMINFVTPIPLASLHTEELPFDLFTAHTNDPGWQIHLPRYAGTKRMNTSLFHTHDDASGLGANAGLSFITASGLPFVLTMPAPATGTRAWTLERSAIDTLYPDITAWATSGGQSHADWYDTNIQTANSYTGGSDGHAPPAPTFLNHTDGTTDLVNDACVVGSGTGNNARTRTPRSTR
ncbi:MAG: LruC domain-containing protein [Deltaproteobacteria bacterium]|nr:LruC domain-containing protein [Deltaproteobacteria bacterium]